MRLVGEAVADEFHTCNLTVLGNNNSFIIFICFKSKTI